MNDNNIESLDTLESPKTLDNNNLMPNNNSEIQNPNIQDGIILDNNLNQNNNMVDMSTPDLGLPTVEELSQNNVEEPPKTKKKGLSGIILIVILLIALIGGYAFYSFYLCSAKNLYEKGIKSYANSFFNTSFKNKKITGNFAMEFSDDFFEEDDIKMPNSIGVNYNIITDDKNNISAELAYLENNKDIISINTLIYNYYLYIVLPNIYDKAILLNDEEVKELIEEYKELLNKDYNNYLENILFKKATYSKKIGNFEYGIGYDNIAYINLSSLIDNNEDNLASSYFSDIESVIDENSSKCEIHTYTNLLGKVNGIKILADGQTIAKISLKNKLNAFIGDSDSNLSLIEKTKNNYNLSLTVEAQELIKGEIKKEGNAFSGRITTPLDDKSEIIFSSSNEKISVEITIDNDMLTDGMKLNIKLTEESYKEGIKFDESNSIDMDKVSEEDQEKISNDIMNTIKESFVGQYISGLFDFGEESYEDSITKNANILIDGAKAAYENEKDNKIVNDNDNVCYSLDWLKENDYYSYDESNQTGSVLISRDGNFVWFSNGENSIKGASEDDVYYDDAEILDESVASNVCQYKTSNIRK